jgi:hypothetical protein
LESKIDGEIPTAVISREDLIRNKLASGREQDLLDVKALRAAEWAVRGGAKRNTTSRKGRVSSSVRPKN